MMKRALILLCLGLPGTATALPDLTPAGGRETQREVSGGGQVRLPDGPWIEDQPPATATGSVTRAAWRIAGTGATPLQIVAPLEQALRDDGFDVLFSCADRVCGGFDFRFSLDLLSPPEMFVDLANYHYLLARQDDVTVSLVASRAGEDGYLHATVVGADLPDMSETPLLETVSAPEPAPEPLAENVITEEPAAPPVTDLTLTQKLTTRGRVALDDLAFGSGAASLTDQPSADLDALAAFLQDAPDSRIALVGHTDAVGSLAANRRLSQARAEAVASRLIERYGIAANRIEAEGAGYLTPRAANTTPEGRAANRRVEAVLLDTE